VSPGERARAREREREREIKRDPLTRFHVKRLSFFWVKSVLVIQHRFADVHGSCNGVRKCGW
jgi:hypothetical protein